MLLVEFGRALFVFSCEVRATKTKPKITIILKRNRKEQINKKKKKFP